MELRLIGGPFDGDVVPFDDDDESDITHDHEPAKQIVIARVAFGVGTRTILNSLYVRRENGDYVFKETRAEVKA